MERIDKDLPASVKNELFIARNYKQIFIASVSLSIISLIVLLFTSIRYSSVIKDQSGAIKNMANKVIFVRADGKVYQLEKEEITQNTVMFALRDLVINYMTVSAFDIADAKSQSEKELTNVVKIKKLAEYVDENGVKGLRAFLEMLYSSYKNNSLPEMVFTPDLTEMRDAVVYQNGKFEYEISMPVVVYYAYAQRWNKGTGNIQVKMSGYIDMSKTTPANPMGIYITNLEVKKYVSKGSI